MSSDSLGQRRQALEDLFFTEVDQKLLEKLRTNLDHEPARRQLAEATQIHNTDLLDKLLELGVDAQTYTAMALLPLAAVAWADGQLHPAERHAVLQAAEGEGIKPGSVSYALLEKWLATPPDQNLLDAWKAYIAELRKVMDPEWSQRMKAAVLDQAERVATSAGGILGLVQKISSAEKRKIDELRTAFGE